LPSKDFVFENFAEGFVLMKLTVPTYGYAVESLLNSGLIEQNSNIQRSARGNPRMRYRWTTEFGELLEEHGYTGVASVINVLRKDGLILNSKYATLFRLKLR